MMRALYSAAFFSTILILSPFAATQVRADESFLPAKRLVYTDNLDLQGRDLAQLFDSSREECEAACLSNTACEALTFNSRSNSCFPKAGVTGGAPYQGALSARVAVTPAKVLTRGAARAATLDVLQSGSLEAARDLAASIGSDHIAGDNSAEELTAAAQSALRAGDTLQAQRLTGAAVSVTDGADQWLDYARLTLRLPQQVMGSYEAGNRALSAAINGYLRGPNDASAAEALLVMSTALEQLDRGREMVPVLRLATGLSPREDIAAALETAIGKYGFHLTENSVESDLANPRICAAFSEDLAKTGVDYASFVKLPETGLSVEPEGAQICVAGLTHGQRYQITFREGLPSATGEALAKDTNVTAYVRDRSPAVRFPGRAYILPRAKDAGLPVETVNADHLDLRLLRISDRNLVESLRQDYFARSLDAWSTQDLADNLTQVVWTGSADVTSVVNRDVTTRLPVQDVTGALGPGIYVLEATIPGKDPYDIPPALQWFAISDLGLSTYWGTDGLTVAVRGLSDVAARPGVTVTLVSRANAVLASAQTDADGIAHFDAGLTRGQNGAAPALVTAALGTGPEEDMSFLSLTDPEFDLSDRGVEGRAPAPAIDVFAATDRGAYRAGEVIHATLLARDSAAQALPGVPLTAVLVRPDGVEYARTLAEDQGAGGATVAFPLSGGVPRGTWRLDVYADPKAAALTSQRLLVEDFLPERIDFALQIPEGPLALDNLPTIMLDARYLFGAPGADLGVEGDLRLSTASALPGYAGYRFGRYDEDDTPYYDSLGAELTDAAGHAEIYPPSPDLSQQTPRPLMADFTLRVREGSGRPVERRESRVVLPATPVIGIRPLFADDALPQNSDAGFELQAIGPDAQPAPMQVHWVINKIETRYQWYSLYGSWNWEAVTSRSRVAEGDATLGAAPAKISARTDWGQYELVVEGPGLAAAAMQFEAGWYAPAGALESPDRLSLSLDKPGYRAGDVAHLRIVPEADGVALVSVLSNRLISLKSVPVTKGENVIDLPVSEEWGAGAYVTASMIRATDQIAGDSAASDRVPVRAVGLAYATVNPGDRALQAVFEMPEASDPRAEMPVALKVTGVKPGETAHVVIAAVDLGILNLTGFKTPDPVDHYFGQRRLGVGLRDIYGRLIDGRSGVEGVIRSGGDASNGLKTQAPPPTEELVAYVSPPLTVDADGYARTTFDMPAFNGTVRLAALVWSESAVGKAEKDVLVRDPVVLTASAPRFLAPGDSARVLLEFAYASGTAGRMGLDVSSDGLTLGSLPSGFDLAEGARKVLSLPISAGSAEGIETLRIALTTPDGKLLEKQLTIPVEALDPPVQRQSRLELAAGQSLPLDSALFEGLRPGSATVTATVGPMARFDTGALLAALDAYPYGCTEQITSKALPLLYLADVAGAMGLGSPADLDDRINHAIEAVLTNQDASGAFGLWSPASGDLWLDSYVSDFLSRARKQGYAVPDIAFRMAMDNLRNQVNYAADFDAGSNGGGADLAYALMVLAREGAAAIGDLRYYADVKGDDFATPLAAAQLGAALASYGDQTRADAMFTRAARMMNGTGPDDAQIWRADYGSALRDRAGVLALAVESGSSAVGVEAAGKSLAQSLRPGSMSTQEATWALLATHALIDRPGADGFTLNGQPMSGPVVRVSDTEAASAPVLRNGSGQSTSVTLTTLGVPEVADPAGGRGYTISRRYYDLDGSEVDPAQLAQGTRLVTVIEVTPHGGGAARLMVQDPLPAGFEIDNPNLIRAGDLASLDWLDVTDAAEMTEFRQDRFLAALNWRSDDAFRLAYIIRAVTPGSYRHPAATVTDMYRPDWRAQTATESVVIE
ncbi:alpha-2-macroglobulin family protein [Phaeovulum sp. W22_SRMD_FR3]|uniref:alpha-2-macroglobulin family protein n=1 Tax=Phaeovulum sp. W22_SRMD_FR3 TaxID=3240274 RepID=UPI003F957BC9